MNTASGFLIAVLLTTAVLTTTLGSRPDSDKTFDTKLTNNKKGSGGSGGNGGNSGGGGGLGGYFGPGGGFGIPGLGNGWANGGSGGYGSGYGGPSGGHSTNGVIRPTVVCKEKGPCYQKKLTCPAKCFSSYSRSGKNFGGGGGGGGCTMDCKKKCVAYC